MTPTPPTSARRALSALAATAWLGTAAQAGPPELVQNDVAWWFDDVGDQEIKLVDPGGNDPLVPGTVPHDLRTLAVMGWAPADPQTDLFTGSVAPAASADFVRLDLVVGGLAGPPGALGREFDPFNPTSISDNPLYGYIEIDADHDPDTGGEGSSLGRFRYLTVTALYNASPGYPPFWTRFARSSEDFDFDVRTFPHYERDGAEFTFVFDGRVQPTVVQEQGDGDGRFEAGETMIVRGRFFERVMIFASVSAFFDGEQIGWWTPEVDVRFSHDVAANETTVSVVVPLRQAGSAAMRGEATVQPLDNLLTNQTSVEEAVNDMIVRAPLSSTQSFSIMTQGWGVKSVSDFLDVTQWEVVAALGHSYNAFDAGGFLAYSDVGFDEIFGDFSRDGVVTGRDAALLQKELEAKDGSTADGDQTVNGSWFIPGWADQFTIFNLQYDHVLDGADVALAPPFTPGDVDGDGGVGPSDLFMLLGSWGLCPTGPIAVCMPDLDADGSVGPNDLFTLLGNWGATGPP